MNRKKTSFTPKRLVVSTVLVLLSICFSLAVGEAALRLMGYQPRSIPSNTHFHSETGWAKQHPVLGYVCKQGVFPSREFGAVPMKFDEMGRRYEPTSVGKQADKAVLVVGGSFTQGYGVADNETYPFLLQQRFPEFDVQNYGCGGYGTYQSLLRMRDYFSSPHLPCPLVIYGYMWAHPERNVIYPAQVFYVTLQDGSWYVRPHVRLKSGGTLAEYPGERIPIWPLETDSSLVARIHRAVVEIGFRAEESMANAVTMALLLQMKEVSEANGADFVVAGLTHVNSQLKEWCAQNGIPLIHCSRREFRKNPKLTRVGGNGHPNGYMHDKWANCIAEWVENHLGEAGKE